MSKPKKEAKLPDIKGKTEKEARKIIRAAGLMCRVVRRDNEKYIITLDLRLDRVNLEIDNGIVTKFRMG